MFEIAKMVGYSNLNFFSTDIIWRKTKRFALKNYNNQLILKGNVKDL